MFGETDPGWPLGHPKHYRNIRRDIRDKLNAYGQKGEPTGGFLRAVLSNDLAGAVSRADVENLPALPAIVAYVLAELPDRSHGSEARVLAWVAEWKANRQEPRLVPCGACHAQIEVGHIAQFQLAVCPTCNREGVIEQAGQGCPRCGHMNMIPPR